ncbi:TOMM precursor leader peptide-binding protein [Halomicrobium salinisoli]|uniref:TOMM precursor leader peptide-binding protein n=1 Tax=Halomicrobium salinisoli TaxID=2878391 RepID=UPI001CF06751|nr:TOMM precursor leader peptide-binding protein [Halomicrobium salinisoli]
MRERLARLGIEYPAVSSVVTPVVLGPDEVHFRAGPWTGPQITVTDDDEDGILADLVAALDGSRSVEALLSDFEDHQTAIVGLLAKLDGENLLVDAGRTRDAQRGLNVVRDRLSPGEFRDRLAAAEAAVVADGETGEYVARNLVSAGIGRLAVSDLGDGDAVAFPDGDRVERVADPERALDGVDAAVACTDAGDAAALLGLNERAHDRDATVVFSQVVGYDGVVGPTVVPGETACLDCYDERVARVHSADRAVYEGFKAGLVERREGSVASPFAQTVAGLTTVEMLRVLAGEPPVLANKVATVDFLDFAFEPNPVLRVPNCATCHAELSERLDWDRFADTTRPDRPGEGP